MIVNVTPEKPTQGHVLSPLVEETTDHNCWVMCQRRFRVRGTTNCSDAFHAALSAFPEILDSKDVKIRKGFDDWMVTIPCRDPIVVYKRRVPWPL